MRAFLMGAAALLSAATANANIVVSEIWAGGLAGTEATSDWFELTNLGGAAVDPTGWYYDDSTNDPTSDDPVLGLGSIAAGESVIVLTSWEDDFLTAADAITAFTAQWDVASSLSGVQIGYVDGGGGLGSGTDAVFIYDGNNAGANTLAAQQYVGPTLPASFVTDGAGNWSNQAAVAGVLGAYESNFAASDGLTEKAVGSPGVIPEPGTLMLLALAGLAVKRR